MTDGPKVDLVNLVGNVLEGQHGDMMRTALSSFLHALMDAQVTDLCGAAYGERSNDRTNDGVHRCEWKSSRSRWVDP